MNEIQTECERIKGELMGFLALIGAIELEPTNLKELGKELEETTNRFSYEGSVIHISVSRLVGAIEEL